MGQVAAVRHRGGSAETARAHVRFASADELRAVLDRTLAEVEGDERAGALLRAARVRVRFRFPDLGVVLDLGASEEPGRNLTWSFSEGAAFEPGLDLAMDSDVANRYLQGRESLAVAIARGRVSCRGDGRSALLYVPATRAIVEPYKRVVRDEYPHLVVD